MKHKILPLIALLLLSVAAQAQFTPLQKYQCSSMPLQEFFLDHVSGYPSTLLDAGTGQYIGQVGDDYKLCGYGRYVTNEGQEYMGIFRDGKFAWGITIVSGSAVIGSDDYHVSYSLSTGRMEYVSAHGTRLVPGEEQSRDYAFVSMRYQNGDQYIGEIYQRKRHGYGIYYYSNGDIWFGSYDNDVRSGYGVLFHENNTIEIGHWEGEDQLRVLKVDPVKQKGKR